MTATELLRKLLDERGVEYSYRSNNRYEVFRMDWCDSCADYLKSIYVKGACIVAELAYLTPAQAIAATLGNEDTYTREDVEGAFVRGYSLGSLPVGSDPQWDENWQTVDEHMEELGWVRVATLGSGECEPVWTMQGYTQTQEFWRCDCGNCGYNFGMEDRRSSPWSVVVGSVDIPNYCPECGTKQKAVKR